MEMTDNQGWTPMHAAAHAGQYAAVTLLAEHCTMDVQTVAVPLPDERVQATGQTALHLALSSPHTNLSVVCALLGAGACKACFKCLLAKCRTPSSSHHQYSTLKRYAAV